MKQGRFVTLDGLRGAAAIFVMLWHYKIAFAHDLPVMPSSYLAVDLFFLISGFVIAASYGRKLRDGLSLPRFFEMRAIRLLPLYWLGCATMLIRSVIATVLDGGLWHLREPVEAMPLSLLLLPNLVHPAVSYLLDPPGWSLFFEMAVNVAFAAGLVRWSGRSVAWLILVTGVALGVSCLHFGSLITHGLFGFATNAERTVFSFMTGAAIFSLWERGRLPRLSISPVLLLPVLILCMSMQVGGTISAVSVIFVVLVIFPVILAIAVQNQPNGRVAVAFALAGDVSYPVYALHWPMMSLLQGPLTSAGLSPSWVAVVLGATTIAVSWLAAVAFDAPVRSLLSRWASLRRSQVERAQAF